MRVSKESVLLAHLNDNTEVFNDKPVFNYIFNLV